MADETNSIVELEKKLKEVYDLAFLQLQNLKTNYGDRTIRITFGGLIGYELGQWSLDGKNWHFGVMFFFLLLLAFFEWSIWRIRRRALERDQAIRRLFGRCECGRFHPHMNRNAPSLAQEGIPHGRDTI